MTEKGGLDIRIEKALRNVLHEYFNTREEDDAEYWNTINTKYRSFTSRTEIPIKNFLNNQPARFGKVQVDKLCRLRVKKFKGQWEEYPWGLRPDIFWKFNGIKVESIIIIPESTGTVTCKAEFGTRKVWEEKNEEW